jgi:hypothetical protein
MPVLSSVRPVCSMCVAARVGERPTGTYKHLENDSHVNIVDRLTFRQRQRREHLGSPPVRHLTTIPAPHRS